MTAETTEPKNKVQIILSFNGRPGLTFNTKYQKPLAKVFSTFAEQMNMEESELRFHFNGERIRPEQTPEELEMEDGDEIQASVMQIGGGGSKQFASA